jgi:lactate dehydrogenase-like 2-hydroxyacid dehydrogenase
MSVQVLMPAKMQQFAVDELDAACRLHKLWEYPDQDAALERLAPDIEVMIVSGWPRKIDAALMKRFPKLRMITITGAGYDKIDAVYAGQNGIVVTNAAQALSEDVADMAMALFLNAVRQIPQAERFMRDGKWTGGNYPLASSLRDRTMGIVGLGRIGKAIARRAEAFGVKVVYTGRTRREGVAYPYFASVEDMAKHCDTLMMSLPGGPETDRIASRAALESLGPQGVFVNISRGSVVDEAALLDLLRSKKLLAAGLDVFMNEPKIDPAFYELDNVALSPHWAAGTHAARGMGQRIACNNVLSWIAGKGPLDPVPETPWPETGRRRA